jgi:hypothetical protein
MIDANWPNFRASSAATSPQMATLAFRRGRDDCDFWAAPLASVSLVTTSKIAGLLVLCALPFFAESALADKAEWADKWEGSYDPGRALRRSDVAIGLSLGVALGGVSGYPNDVQKLNDPAYEANLGAAAGGAGALWLGGALRDWFVFGVGYASSTTTGHGYTSVARDFILHIEGFPLFAKGGVWQNLALIGDFGGGAQKITKQGLTSGDGGAMAFVAFGVLYEPLRLGDHFSGGPVVEVTEQFSASLNAMLVTGGFQIAFYGGPS